MADLALDGHAAVLADDLRDAARAAQVEHHRGAGRALERVGDQPAEQQVAADRSALLVEHDAAVGVAVEAETSVETALRHHGLEIAQVGGDERIRLVHELALRVVEVERLDRETLGTDAQDTACAWEEVQRRA